MRTYALRRILQTIPIIFIISILLFLMVRAAPGGPLTAARRNPNITREQLELLEEKLGLNDPLLVQYGRWLSDMFSGNMEESIKFHRPVSEMISERIPNTLTLVGASFLLTLILAVPIGVLSARKPYSFFDYAMTTVTFIGQSIPVYWLGLGLIVIFYVTLKNPLTGDPLFPVGTLVSSSHTPGVRSTVNRVQMQWSGAGDVGSGVAGYSVAWDTQPKTVPDTILDLGAGDQHTTSPPLPDGRNFYFHLRTADQAGNWAPNAVHLGPFWIDCPMAIAPTCPSLWSAIDRPPSLPALRPVPFCGEPAVRLWPVVQGSGHFDKAW